MTPPNARTLCDGHAAVHAEMLEERSQAGRDSSDAPPLLAHGSCESHDSPTREPTTSCELDREFDIAEIEL